MSKKKPSSEGALFVRLPATAVDKLDRAADALGVRKKDLVAGLVSKYVNPDSRQGLRELSDMATHPRAFEASGRGPAVGSYSFQPYELPEVMNPEQAGQFLQLDEAVIIELAEAGKLPGRKLANTWRFAKESLIAWLSTAESK